MATPLCFTMKLDDREVFITGEYYCGHPGCSYRRNGDPGDPPEPSDFEVKSSKLKDGTVVEIDANDDELFEKIIAAADEAFYQYNEGSESKSSSETIFD